MKASRTILKFDLFYDKELFINLKIIEWYNYNNQLIKILMVPGFEPEILEAEICFSSTELLTTKNLFLPSNILYCIV